MQAERMWNHVPKLFAITVQEAQRAPGVILLPDYLPLPNRQCDGDAQPVGRTESRSKSGNRPQGTKREKNAGRSCG